MAKNPQKTFEVTLRISGDKVETIMGLVAGECTLVSMKETAGAPAQERRQFYAGGKKNKGVSGERLLLGILRLGPTKRASIKAAFAGAGFAGARRSGYVPRNPRRIRNPRRRWRR